MVFGRDGLILVKDNNLLSSFRIVTYLFFDGCIKVRLTAAMGPDNVILKIRAVKPSI